MRSVVDRNVVMRRIAVLKTSSFEDLQMKCLFKSIMYEKPKNALQYL